jgi:hypothetical protein
VTHDLQEMLQIPDEVMADDQIGELLADFAPDDEDLAQLHAIGPDCPSDAQDVDPWDDPFDVHNFAPGFSLLSQPFQSCQVLDPHPGRLGDCQQHAVLEAVCMHAAAGADPSGKLGLLARMESDHCTETASQEPSLTAGAAPGVNADGCLEPLTDCQGESNAAEQSAHPIDRATTPRPPQKLRIKRRQQQTAGAGSVHAVSEHASSSKSGSMDAAGCPSTQPLSHGSILYEGGTQSGVGRMLTRRSTRVNRDACLPSPPSAKHAHCLSSPQPAELDTLHEQNLAQSLGSGCTAPAARVGVGEQGSGCAATVVGTSVAEQGAGCAASIVGTSVVEQGAPRKLRFRIPRRRSLQESPPTKATSPESTKGPDATTVRAHRTAAEKDAGHIDNTTRLQAAHDEALVIATSKSRERPALVSSSDGDVSVERTPSMQKRSMASPRADSATVTFDEDSAEDGVDDNVSSCPRPTTNAKEGSANSSEVNALAKADARTSVIAAQRNPFKRSRPFCAASLQRRLPEPAPPKRPGATSLDLGNAAVPRDAIANSAKRPRHAASHCSAPATSASGHVLGGGRLQSHVTSKPGAHAKSPNSCKPKATSQPCSYTDASKRLVSQHQPLGPRQCCIMHSAAGQPFMHPVERGAKANNASHQHSTVVPQLIQTSTATLLNGGRPMRPSQRIMGRPLGSATHGPKSGLLPGPQPPIRAPSTQIGAPPGPPPPPQPPSTLPRRPPGPRPPSHPPPPPRQQRFSLPNLQKPHCSTAPGGPRARAKPTDPRLAHRVAPQHSAAPQVWTAMDKTVPAQQAPQHPDSCRVSPAAGAAVSRSACQLLTPSEQAQVTQSLADLLNTIKGESSSSTNEAPPAAPPGACHSSPMHVAPSTSGTGISQQRKSAEPTPSEVVPGDSLVKLLHLMRGSTTHAPTPSDVRKGCNGAAAVVPKRQTLPHQPQQTLPQQWRQTLPHAEVIAAADRPQHPQQARPQAEKVADKEPDAACKAGGFASLIQKMAGELVESDLADLAAMSCGDMELQMQQESCTRPSTASPSPQLHTPPVAEQAIPLLNVPTVGIKAAGGQPPSAIARTKNMLSANQCGEGASEDAGHKPLPSGSTVALPPPPAQPCLQHQRSEKTCHKQEAGAPIAWASGQEDRSADHTASQNGPRCDELPPPPPRLALKHRPGIHGAANAGPTPSPCGAGDTAASSSSRHTFRLGNVLNSQCNSLGQLDHEPREARHFSCSQSMSCKSILSLEQGCRLPLHADPASVSKGQHGQEGPRSSGGHADPACGRHGHHVKEVPLSSIGALREPKSHERRNSLCTADDGHEKGGRREGDARHGKASSEVSDGVSGGKASGRESEGLVKAHRTRQTVRARLSKPQDHSDTAPFPKSAKSKEAEEGRSGACKPSQSSHHAVGRLRDADLRCHKRGLNYSCPEGRYGSHEALATHARGNDGDCDRERSSQRPGACTKGPNSVSNSRCKGSRESLPREDLRHRSGRKSPSVGPSSEHRSSHRRDCDMSRHEYRQGCDDRRGKVHSRRDPSKFDYEFPDRKRRVAGESRAAHGEYRSGSRGRIDHASLDKLPDANDLFGFG